MLSLPLVTMLRRGKLRPTLVTVAMVAVAVGLLAGPHLLRVAGVWGRPSAPAAEAAPTPVRATSRTAPAPATAPPAAVETAPIGNRVYISGCDFGVLKVPVVDLWDSPERARVVGEVSGDGPAELDRRCLGAVVIIRSVDVDLPTPMYEVETVVGRERGWLSERFIGPTFDISLCGAFFSHSSAAAGKCRG